MCDRQQWGPAGGCCGSAAPCLQFAAVNWNRCTWLVRQPAAVAMEERYAEFGYSGSPLIFVPDDNPETNAGTYYAYAVVIQLDPIPLNDDPEHSGVLIGWHGYHVRGGEFAAVRQTNPCHWIASTRERLCPGLGGLARVESANQKWYPDRQQITPYVAEWSRWQGQVPAGDTWERVSGSGYDPAAGTNYDGLGWYQNWRHILQAAECLWLPEQSAAGFGVYGLSGIEGGLLTRLEAARELLQYRLEPTAENVAWWRQRGWYKPTALDLAAGWTLSGGLEFGVVSDRRSPLYGQFCIWEGGMLQREDGVLTEYQSQVDGLEYWLHSSPWELVSGSAVVAEFGHVNRFERTNDNDALPAWVELELVRW